MSSISANYRQLAANITIYMISAYFILLTYSSGPNYCGILAGHRPDRSSNRHESNITMNPPLGVYPYLITNPTFCHLRQIKYIIYVYSSPGNHLKRDTIRDTWASKSLHKENIFKTVFVLGQTKDTHMQDNVITEYKKYRDIVQFGFLDSHNNLTLKGVMALKWISEYCSQVKFVIKVDDTTFVNINALIPLLDEFMDMKHIIAGNILWDRQIERDPATCKQSCVHQDEFPGKAYYPPFCSGLGYIISMDLVPMLYLVSMDIPYFHMEDVYITRLLPQNIEQVQYIQLESYYTSYAEQTWFPRTIEPFSYLFVETGDLPMNHFWIKRLKGESLLHIAVNTLTNHPIKNGVVFNYMCNVWS